MTDSSGQQLPRVTVTEKGTRNAATTGTDGSFTISVAGPRAVLVFTHIGFATHEAVIGNLTNVSVSLQPERRDLGEVVVIGYGTAKRKDVTGAISSISSKDFNQGEATTPAAFYFSFSANDARSKMWLIGQQYSSTGQVLVDPKTGVNVNFSPWVLQLSNPADSFRNAGARSIKYYPQSGTSGNKQSNDGVIFRLSDAYLMRAEAELRAGSPGDALTLVNTIRQRSGVQAWTMDSLTMPNLLAERGREFAWEGWRRNDLIRFEVADGVRSYSLYPRHK